GFVQQRDQFLYFLLFRRAAVLGSERQVDLVDFMRSAEVAQGFAPGRKVENKWRLLHPKSMDCWFLGSCRGYINQQCEERDRDPHGRIPLSFSGFSIAD